MKRMCTVLLGDSRFMVSWKDINKTELLKRVSELAHTGCYQVRSAVTDQVFGDFLARLSGEDVEVTGANYRELKELCDEFGYSGFEKDFSSWRACCGEQGDEQVLELRRRLADVERVNHSMKLENKMLKDRLSALESKFAALTSMHKQLEAEVVDLKQMNGNLKLMTEGHGNTRENILPETQSIFIVTITGRQLVIPVKAHDSVLEIKGKVCEREGILIDEFALVFGSRQLDDDEQIGLPEWKNQTLRMILKPQHQRSLYIKTLGGKKFHVPYCPTTTIAEVQETVTSYLKAVEPVRLISKGKQLSNGKASLKDYDIRPGETIYAFDVLRKHMLYVKRQNGETEEIAFNPEDRVTYIKTIIAEKFGIPTEKQHLTWQGKRLRDKYTLLDYGIQPNATIDLTS